MHIRRLAVPHWPVWRTLVLLILFILLLLIADSSSAGNVLAAETSLEQARTQGLRALQQGAFTQAIDSWTAVARLSEEAGNPNQQSDALVQLSQAYQALGQYQEAVKNLEAALALVQQSNDQTRLATVLASLGRVYSATEPAETAQQYLYEGLGIARELGDAALLAVILNNLGYLFTHQEKHQEAIGAYQESAQHAQTSGNPLLTAKALSNAARALISLQHYQASKALLDQAVLHLQDIPPSYAKAYQHINIGLAYNDLRVHTTASSDALLLQAFTQFQAAASMAETIGNVRLGSYARGYLGNLYEEEGRYQEALTLTRQARFAAQQVNAPELLYRWQWQTGRLFKAQGNSDEAMAAYRQAVKTLQSLRQETVIGFGRPQASFRESIGQVYFELVDLLLQRASALTQPEQLTASLVEARDTVELFKAAELQNYFQDECVQAARSSATRLDTVSQTAAIVYPISLSDRLELLVSLPTGLKQFVVPVEADTLVSEVRAFRQKLEKRSTREYLPHAQQLYEWLIRPLEPDLNTFDVHTLVFVPDGALRTIPMAALHDGTRFLIRKYALATTPGLDLTDPRPMQRENLQVLAIGLTQAVQGFPALPHVSAEMEALEQLYRGDQLLNQDFLTERMANALREETFSIVHIASHGQFAGDSDDTFLLTFDDKLTIDRLEQVVGLFRFRDDPLELLTLSACQTAAGNDQAALGLAGVAIKAGARSALATLWYINDQASSALVVEFYRQLKDPSVSRAVALQRAQLQLLKERRYQHPAYWSPFLLINNWL